MDITPFIWAATTALISSVVAAIVSAVITKIKVARKAAGEARQDSEELKKLILDNTKMTCRLAIYDEHFSVDEKLSAYEIYRSHGWNHQTKTYMDQLVGGDVDEYLERHDVRS